MTTTPREASLEFFLNGWTAITARQTSPITMSRGRLDWGGETSPSRFSAMLDNRSGDLNPDNPMGTYYKLLNRNTPLRYAYVLLRDTFGRTSTDSWGSTTPDGVEGHVTASLAYTLSGTAANFDVGSGVGTMVIASASDQRRAYLPGAVHRIIDVTVDIPTMTAPASGNNVQSILLRGVSLTNYVAVDVDVTAAGVVRIAIRDTDDTTYLFPRTTVAGVVRTSPMRLRAQVEGQTVRGKVWNPSGDNEPYDFQADTVSTDMAYSGWIGLRAATGTGNTNVTFSFDNLIVSSGRYFGLARKISPRADSTGRNKFTMIEGAGALRLIERNGPLHSTLRRGITAAAVQPVAYWSCEDGKDAARFTPVIGTGSIVAVAGVTKPATNDDFRCSDRLPTLNGALLAVEMPSYANPNSSAQIRFLLSVPTDGDTPDGGVILRAYTSGTAAFWDVVYYTTASGSLGVNAYNQAGTQILTTGATLSGNNGRPARIILDLVQDGADIDWALTIGPVPTEIDSGSAFGTSGTLAAYTFSLISLLSIGSAGGFLNTAFGHVSVHNTITSVLDLRNELGAYAGEKAGRRAERLCDESGIQFSYLGDLDLTQKMGPQRPGKLIDLLRECEAADLGTLLEPRMTAGIFYRTGATLDNQAVGVTLDHSAGQLAERIEPDYDDQDTRNKITIKRTQGGEYEAIQETGPRNVNDPGDDPDGVGVYADPPTVNVHSETQLPNIGEWLRHLGTFPDPRIPGIVVNAASRNITAALDAALLSMDVDDRIVIENLTSQDRYEPHDQLARGYTETLDTIFLNSIVFTAAPAAPYNIMVWNDADSQWDSDTTTLNEELDTTETGVDVAISGGPLWTTAAADCPFDIMVEGERMTVTAVSGASSPQTFTVTRSVNGVVKGQSIGDKVGLAEPVYWGLQGE